VAVLSAEYVFSVVRGALRPPHDHGAVAVIDGTTVKITPFRTANIPPPMSMYEVVAKSAVIDVAFSPTNSHMAVLHHKGIDLYAWQTKGSRSLVPKLLRTLKSESSAEKLSLQVCLPGSGEVHLLYRDSDADVVVSTCGFDEATGDTVSISPQTVGAGSILVPSDVSGRAHVQNRSGRLFRLGEKNSAGTETFPTQLPWTESTSRGDDLLAVGLSKNGHLYAGNRLLTKSCSSFLLTPEHLVLTTTNHLLKFVHLTNVEGSFLFYCLGRSVTVLTTSRSRSTP